jgi:hypothetical protein
MPKRLVVYHASCADGHCAAWLFSKAFPDAEFLPVQHGDAPPDVAGKHVYVLDFSYSHDVMAGMVKDTGGEFVVLDHHATAERELAGLEGHYVFDLNKSGARLAWEFLWDNRLLPASFVFAQHSSREVPPWLVRYTEDRDLWRWELLDSKKINAALRSYPLTFPTWDMLHARVEWALVDEGGAILRAEEQTVARHVAHAAEVVIAGHRVLCVNATTLASEIAGELARNRPFGAVYFDRADGTRVYSLRSDRNGLDVSEVAKRFGGGGHVRAAGFQVWEGFQPPVELRDVQPRAEAA